MRHSVTFPVPTDSTWYRGSGQAVAAIENGIVVDAVYSGIDVERADRATLAQKHPRALIVAGMLSCYELTLFDSSELQSDNRGDAPSPRPGRGH